MHTLKLAKGLESYKASSALLKIKRKAVEMRRNYGGHGEDLKGSMTTFRNFTSLLEAPCESHRTIKLCLLLIYFSYLYTLLKN